MRIILLLAVALFLSGCHVEDARRTTKKMISNLMRADSAEEIQFWREAIVEYTDEQARQRLVELRMKHE